MTGHLLTPEHRRVCIVLLTGIGDVVHGLPVANALKEMDPRREMVWVAEPAPAEVLRKHPAVDHVLVFAKKAGPRGVRALRRGFRSLRCDVTLNMQRYLKSAFPTMFSGARIRIGMDPSKTRDGIRYLHSHHLPEGPWRHTQDLFLDFLPPLGVPVPEEPRWRIQFSDAEIEERDGFFRALGDRPVAGVVTATSNPRKDWPQERYIPLVEGLEWDLGYTVLLLGGPGAREREVAHVVSQGGRSKPVWGLADSVRTLMWRLSGCSLLISPDTGPLHIAHAMEVPVVSLYGHTNPWRVGPYSRYHDLLIDRYTDPGEAPDASGYDPKMGRMEQISVSDVLERVELARSRYGV